MMGAERKSMVMSEAEKRNTAFHEAGHAIVGRLMPEHDPVYKVSIIPRGRALGVTMFLPEEDRYSLSKRYIRSQICSLYGGRIAEEMTLGKDGVTTGASNDIERASEIARNMVTKWGLSEKMGPLMYDEGEEEIFLGRSAGMPHKSISAETAKNIDQEVRSIIDECYSVAQGVLEDNVDKLHLMADALMLYETLDASQIDAVMEGKMPDPPEGWSDSHDDSSDSSNASADQESQASAEPGKDSTGPIGGPAQDH
jgi:cell division protease FtsH